MFACAPRLSEWEALEADQHLIGHMPKKKRPGLFLSALISLDLSAIRTLEYAMSNVSSNSKLLSCGLLK